MLTKESVGVERSAVGPFETVVSILVVHVVGHSDLSRLLSGGVRGDDGPSVFHTLTDLGQCTLLQVGV